MLKRIRIERFKCFKDVTIHLNKLSILAGANGTGKSSAIQPLVLMMQTIRKNRYSKDIIFNGEALELGSYEEIVNQFSRRLEGIEFTFFSDETTDYNDELRIELQIDENPQNEFLGRIFQVEISDSDDPDISGNNMVFKQDSKFLNLFPIEDKFNNDNLINLYLRVMKFFDMTKIHYLSAERLGPRETYPGTYFEEHPWVGYKGEFTAQYLERFASKKVNEKFIKYAEEKTLNSKRISNILRRQVENWMKYIISGEGINFEKIKGTNLLKLSYKPSKKLDYFRPSNSAFGFSYTLPIIVACLGANEGDILIIENPEAHLHPLSQSRMGEFLALTASTGVQVIVETHSDHILNGARKSVFQGVLEPVDVEISFFRLNEEGFSEVIRPKIDKHGKIDKWPEGFFDQFELDLSFLMGFNDEDIS
ncbi:MAG: DUF3696 domain-containing protein [Candidatus Eremiobacteraeota bacterium]|nr:DUF3696 domain-containing protein [Candidatus Eremiobacteraeota bacterium]